MRPDDIFDRDEEWRQLERFVTANDNPAHLAIVTGRRRTGKTFLLRRLAAAHDGVYFPSVAEERSLALGRFGEALAAHLGIPLPNSMDWSAALALATSGRLAVPLLVVDELPYLLEHSPELESVLQHLLDALQEQGGTKIVVCGSALSVMTGLAGGNRPLRGRSGLELRLSPFDFRTNRQFWRMDDVSVAFRLDATLGGLPGYRRLVRSVPGSLADLDGWMLENLYSPSSALYREDDYILGEDRRVGDRAIYRSLAATIAAGEHRPSRIAGRVGRPQTSLSPAFRVLVESGLVVNDAGLLSGRDPLYRLADPLLRFIGACVAPWRPMVEDDRARQAWETAQPAWRAQVLGPHLETLAQTWTARFAAERTLGGPIGLVGRAEVADASARRTREIDVVALAPGERVGTGARVVAIGECKLSASLDALRHLDASATVLEGRGHGRPARLLLFAETFDDDLRAAANARRDVELVDLHRLYEGE